ncbi:MAG: NifU family protein [Candidatus Sumerlaeia bacterium]|nr:NifU family protein [Candidatus Sumerlaeia bacterium]
MIIQIIDMEPTPNPNAYKFITDQELLAPGKKINLMSHEDYSSLPLAKELFGLNEDLETILITENFVSLSGSRLTDWQIVHACLERHISGFDRVKAETLADAQKASFAQKRAELPAGDVVNQIEDLLETFVRPALAGDGGGVELVGVEDNIVLIRYQGACGSCPTSTANTLNAIQNLLRTKLGQDFILQPA